MNKNIIIAITGATGAIYGLRTLEILKKMGIKTHLIISSSGLETIEQELSLNVKDIKALADYNYNVNNIGAGISSGSFLIDGMLIAPCSIKTLSGIANSYNSNLIVRSADVTLKERRPLVLMVRETPLHSGHLNLMLKATSSGAIIAPNVPAFYNKPSSIDDIVNHSIYRALDLLGIHSPLAKRWQ